MREALGTFSAMSEDARNEAERWSIFRVAPDGKREFVVNALSHAMTLTSAVANSRDDGEYLYEVVGPRGIVARFRGGRALPE